MEIMATLYFFIKRNLKRLITSKRIFKKVMDQWVTIKLVDMVDISHSAIFEKSKIGPTYLCCISIRG